MHWLVKLKMSIYTNSIQETNSITVKYHQPVVLLKFAMYKMLFSKCRCHCPIHEMWCMTMVQWRHSYMGWIQDDTLSHCDGQVALSGQPHDANNG